MNIREIIFRAYDLQLTNFLPTLNSTHSLLQRDTLCNVVQGKLSKAW